MEIEGYADLNLVHKMAEHVKTQEPIEFEFQPPTNGKLNGKFYEIKQNY